LLVVLPLGRRFRDGHPNCGPFDFDFPAHIAFLAGYNLVDDPRRRLMNDVIVWNKGITSGQDFLDGPLRSDVRTLISLPC
jgi:hypothetical protein